MHILNVSALLEDLSAELPEDIEADIKKMKEDARPKVKFVKSSEGLGGRMQSPGNK